MKALPLTARVLASALNPAFAEDAPDPQVSKEAEALPKPLEIPEPVVQSRDRSLYEIIKFSLTGWTFGCVTGMGATLAFTDNVTALYAGMGAGGALGVAGVLISDQVGSPYKYGQAGALSSGQLTGFALAVAQLPLISSFYDEREERSLPMAATMIAGHLAGLGAGALVYNFHPLTPGQSALISTGALFGSGLSLLTGALTVDFEGKTIDLENNELRFISGLATASTLVFTGLGYALADAYNPSVGRVYITAVSGMAGASVGAFATFIPVVSGNADLWLLGTGIASGTLLGLSLGWYFTRDMEPDYLNDAPALNFGLAPIEKGSMAVVSGTF